MRGAYLKIEVVVVYIRDTIVHDRARQSVAVLADLLRCGTEHTSMVTLAADDDGNGGTVCARPACSIELLERFQDLRQLLHEHFLVLALQSYVSSEAQESNRLCVPQTLRRDRKGYVREAPSSSSRTG